MIKKVKYLLVIFMIFTQFSCNNFLELIPPNGLIREEFWKTKEDVEAVLMASYEAFASLNRDLLIFGEIRGDMLEGGVNQGWNEQLLSENNIYPDNSICNWRNFYEVINY